jgi:ribonuclease-3
VYNRHLQEYYQSKNQVCKIRYIVTKEEGPDHEKMFHVNVLVNKVVVGTGSGKSKKIAEQDAAKSALVFEGQINE